MHVPAVYACLSKSVCVCEERERERENKEGKTMYTFMCLRDCLYLYKFSLFEFTFTLFQPNLHYSTIHASILVLELHVWCLEQ